MKRSTANHASVVRSRLALAMVGCFAAVVVLLVATEKLALGIGALYAVASSVTFLVYANDKEAAKANRWRTQESTLHLLGLIGGWPGGLAAQQLLRHKSKKVSFQFVFWCSVAANVAVLLWLLSPPGKAFLLDLLRR